MLSVGILWRVRLRASKVPFGSKIFDIKNFFAPAGKIFVRNGVRSRRNPCRLVVRTAQLAHDPRRSPTSVPSVGMLSCVRLRANSARKFSKFFGGRKIFRSPSRAIAPNSMPAGAAQLAHDPRRSPTMANICAERRHPMAREIACDFGSKIFEIFRRPEKFSFEIA